jgi:uncharacterized membrane protein (DUF485 family)
MATKKMKKRLVILAIIVAVVVFFRKWIMAQINMLKAKFTKK